MAGDADVGWPAIPNRQAGQVTVGEPSVAQIRCDQPGSPRFLAAAILTGAEPVRPELR